MKKKLTIIVLVVFSFLIVGCGNVKSNEIDETINNTLNGEKNYLRTYSANFIDGEKEYVESFVVIDTENYKQIHEKLNTINYDNIKVDEIKIRIVQEQDNVKTELKDITVKD